MQRPVTINLDANYQTPRLTLMDSRRLSKPIIFNDLEKAIRSIASIEDRHKVIKEFNLTMDKMRKFGNDMHHDAKVGEEIGLRMGDVWKWIFDSSISLQGLFKFLSDNTTPYLRIVHIVYAYQQGLWELMETFLIDIPATYHDSLATLLEFISSHLDHLEMVLGHDVMYNFWQMIRTIYPSAFYSHLAVKAIKDKMDQLYAIPYAPHLIGTRPGGYESSFGNDYGYSEDDANSIPVIVFSDLSDVGITTDGEIVYQHSQGGDYNWDPNQQSIDGNYTFDNGDHRYINCILYEQGVDVESHPFTSIYRQLRSEGVLDGVNDIMDHIEIVNLIWYRYDTQHIANFVGRYSIAFPESVSKSNVVVPLILGSDMKLRANPKLDLDNQTLFISGRAVGDVIISRIYDNLLMIAGITLDSRAPFHKVDLSQSFYDVPYMIFIRGKEVSVQLKR